MPKEQKTRAQMDARFLWKLEDIYPTDQAWEEDFQKAKPAAARVAAFAGKLEQQLPEALCALEEAELLLTRLYAYARMRRDEDNGNTTYQGLGGPRAVPGGGAGRGNGLLWPGGPGARPREGRGRPARASGAGALPPPAGGTAAPGGAHARQGGGDAPGADRGDGFRAGHHLFHAHRRGHEVRLCHGRGRREGGADARPLHPAPAEPGPRRAQGGL